MKGKLIVETSININAAPSKVWEALTTPKMIKKYLLGTEVSTDWKEGSAILYKGQYQGKKYLDKGVIWKVVPEKELQSTYWSSLGGKEDRADNYKLITYRINEKNNKTILTLTQDNNKSEREKEHLTENWNQVLHKLKEVVEDDRGEYQYDL